MLPNQAIFELTEKGKHEVSTGMNAGGGITGDAKFILPLFGNGLTFDEVVAKLPPSIRACCVATVNNLLAEGYLVAASVIEQSVPPVNCVAHADEVADDAHAQLLVEEAVGLDFTGKFLQANQSNSAADKPLPFVVSESLDEEIESRSKQLADEKIKQFEQEIDNTLTQLAEHESLQAEREKLAKQHEMLESARLSPIYDNLKELVFFKDFSDAELGEVLHIGVWQEMNEHDTLLHEGDFAKVFYVMLNGMAGVFKRDRLIGLVQGGESFGESSLLVGDEEIHHADVIARTHVEFMGFCADQLQQNSMELRLKFFAAILRCQTRRLICANEQIVNLLAHEK